jgi:sulfite reductase (NADPH) flavoprotein alpha-component
MKPSDFAFESRILSYERLTPQEDTKHTYHLEITWNRDLPYNVGDSVAIRPLNRHEWIEPLLEHTEDETKRHDYTQALLRHLNVKTISGKLLRALLPYAKDQVKEQFEACLKDSQAMAALNEQFEAWQLPKALNLLMPLETFISGLMPLHPRFYSIASSFNLSPEKIALTIAHVEYTTPQAPSSIRHGVCSDFLYRSHLSRETAFEAWIHPAKDFYLADSQRNILMIGPGTGIAPFRAFMQERLFQKAQGHLMGKSWIFFGERYPTCFFYKDFWQQCQKTLDFEITCAFSREQSHKVYVQDKLWQERNRVWPFLEEGIIYVCGDAKHMAKDVEATLLGIIEEVGGYEPQSAKDYLKNLRKEKRYLRDVY